MSNGILFVDIDGTFLRWSLFLYLVEGLIEKGILPAETKALYAKEEKSWRRRQSSYDDYLMAAVRAYEKNLNGVSEERMIEVAKQVVFEHREEVYIYTRDLIREKIKDGWYVAAISSSQKETVEPFAEYWGIHETFSTELVKENGCYTGKRNLLTDKAGIVKKVLERKEFNYLPPEKIWAVGDSEGDICMLEAVGKPICFNPSQKLLDEAKKRGWPVIVERKSVVYFIQ